MHECEVTKRLRDESPRFLLISGRIDANPSTNLSKKDRLHMPLGKAAEGRRPSSPSSVAGLLRRVDSPRRCARDTMIPEIRKASWSAPALWRFARRQDVREISVRTGLQALGAPTSRRQVGTVCRNAAGRRDAGAPRRWKLRADRLVKLPRPAGVSGNAAAWDKPRSGLRNKNGAGFWPAPLSPAPPERVLHVVIHPAFALRASARRAGFSS